MKIRSFAVVALGILFLGHPANTALLAGASSDVALVSNSNDSGPGSFRAAIDLANADPDVAHVQFTGSARVIALQQTVNFTGAQALTIRGNGAVLDGSGIALGAAFLATGGGVTISRLTVRDAPAEGIAVEVPAGATGTIYVWLAQVEVRDNRGHGVLVNEQEILPRWTACSPTRTAPPPRYSSRSPTAGSWATATASRTVTVCASTKGAMAIWPSSSGTPWPPTMRPTGSRWTNAARATCSWT